MDEIIGEFVVESMEGIDRLDQNLIVLETDPKNHGILDDIFRTLHSIKGACGFLDFATLEKVAHRGENLLSLLREDVLDVTPEITDALLATVDAIRAMLEVVGESGEEGSQDVSELLITLERIAAQGDPNAEPADPNAEAEMPHQDGDATNDAPADPDAAATEGDRVGDILTENGEADRIDVEIAAKEQELGDERAIGEILMRRRQHQPKLMRLSASKPRPEAVPRSTALFGLTSSCWTS
jgi:two-component system chemotaxis sensor kinase CheA